MSSCSGVRPSSRSGIRAALPAAALLLATTVALALSSAWGSALASSPSSSQSTTPPVPPAKPPTARTGTFPEVALSSATLRGQVNPHGSETSYYFQYGITTAYGAQTETAAAGDGSAEVGVAQAITGLAPDTTYHYRLVATSTAGTALGEDHSFTTRKVALAFDATLAPSREVFGGSLQVTGTLTGSEAANHLVVLQSNPFPYLSGFKDVGSPQETSAAGSFAFVYRDLSQNTEFRVATVPSTGAATTVSKAMIALVEARATLHVRPTGRPHRYLVYGSVLPGEPGATLLLQRIRPGHRPETVYGTTLRHARSRISSHYSQFVHIARPGRYRAFVVVSNGRQMSHWSRPVMVR